MFRSEKWIFTNMKKALILFAISITLLQACVKPSSTMMVHYELELIAPSAFLCLQEDLTVEYISNHAIEKTPLSFFKNPIKTKNTTIYKGSKLHYSGEQIIFLVGCRNTAPETYHVMDVNQNWSKWITPDYLNTSDSPNISELSGSYEPEADDYRQIYLTRMRFRSEPWTQPSTR
jgi:hypothetical protein